MRRLSPVLVTAMLTTLAPLALAAREKAPAARAPAPIVVTGRGSASFTPRNVQVHMTLTTTDRQAEASRNSNAGKVATLKQALSGVPGLKASQIQLGAPTTQRDGDYDGNGNFVLKGWVTTQTVTVTARAKDPTNIAGRVFDTGVANKAEVSQPSPLVTERAIEGARQRAENQALRNAQRRAERMARTLNLQLSGVTAVREASEQVFHAPRSLALESARAAAPSNPTQFDVGKQTLRETRTVEFQLR